MVAECPICNQRGTQTRSSSLALLPQRNIVSRFSMLLTRAILR